MPNSSAIKSQTIADLGEFGLIRRIKSLLPDDVAGVVLSIGDDAAAVRPTPGKLLLSTCDIQVQDRHFRLDHTTAYELGRRCAAINLSDIAAMGGEPRHALISLALPQDTPVAWVDGLYHGMLEEFARYDTGIIGGNLSSVNNGIVIDVTLTGEVEEGHMLTRSGARSGDVLLVTGDFGASLLGRLALESSLDRNQADIARCVNAHLAPTPRVHEGLAISERQQATAMIDVSDGLAGDLGHICQASGVGARIVASRLPIADETRETARRLGLDPLQAALHGGEDYQLIVACPQDHAKDVTQEVFERTGTAMTEIGQITGGGGVTLVATDGVEHTIPPAGWDHFHVGKQRP